MSQNRAAYLLEAGARELNVQDAPLHLPGPGEVIIKNRAVAINPVDWKMQDYGILIDSYPAVFGCDCAGVIEAVGDSVSDLQPGDRVIGQAAILTLGPKYAAFQSYVPCRTNVVCKIPDELSFTQGCVIPLAINTAAMGLFTTNNLNLPLPSINSPASNRIILIYGGSTSVGSSAIQLAKAAGATVVVTASTANHEYCRNLGADHALDYKHPGWMDEAIAILQDKNKEFAGIYDAVGEASVYRLLADLVSRMSSQVPVATVGMPTAEIKANNVFGAELTLNEELAKAVWYDYLPHALANGNFVSKPDALVVGSGLEEIQNAMNVQRKGVSAKKVVVEIL